MSEQKPIEGPFRVAAAQVFYNGKPVYETVVHGIQGDTIIEEGYTHNTSSALDLVVWIESLSAKYNARYRETITKLAADVRTMMNRGNTDKAIIAAIELGIAIQWAATAPLDRPAYQHRQTQAKLRAGHRKRYGGADPNDKRLQAHRLYKELIDQHPQWKRTAIHEAIAKRINVTSRQIRTYLNTTTA